MQVDRTGYSAGNAETTATANRPMGSWHASTGMNGGRSQSIQVVRKASSAGPVHRFAPLWAPRVYIHLLADQVLVL